MFESGWVKKAKDHVEEGLEKVRAKPWATPLGKALETSGEILSFVGDFVPGAGIIGGALSFGATLLNPDPPKEDLEKQLSELKEEIKQSTSQAVVAALEKAQHDLEFKIAHPLGEIRKEFGEVRTDMQRILKKVELSSASMAGEMTKMKDLISQTFHIVVDTRFKVCPCLPIVQIDLISFFVRTASRRLMRLILSFSAMVSRISSNIHLSCKLWPLRTWIQ